MSRTHPGTRKATNKLLEMLDNGELDAASVLRDALGWMSESDVSEFAQANQYFDDDDGDDDDDDDDDEEEGV